MNGKWQNSELFKNLFQKSKNNNYIHGKFSFNLSQFDSNMISSQYRDNNLFKKIFNYLSSKMKKVKIIIKKFPYIILAIMKVNQRFWKNHWKIDIKFKRN